MATSTRLNTFGALALNGFREARRNRITVVIGAFAVVALISGTLVNEVTVATFHRVLTDFGLGVMSLLSVFLTIFLSSGLLSREIERRTIFMMVSKPVSRTEFLIGRMAGNLLTIAAVLAGMTAVFALQMWGLGVEVTKEHLQAIVGLYLELVLLTAAGFFFSSFAGQLVGAVGVSGIYFAGHLAADLYATSQRSPSPGMQTLGRIVYYAVPNLERFNFRPAAGYQAEIPLSDLGGCLLYTLAWSALFLALASVIFRRRDFR